MMLAPQVLEAALTVLVDHQRKKIADEITHLARACHECEVKRGRLSWWLNQFATPSDGRPGSLRQG